MEGRLGHRQRLILVGPDLGAEPEDVGSASGEHDVGSDEDAAVGLTGIDALDFDRVPVQLRRLTRSHRSDEVLPERTARRSHQDQRHPEVSHMSG
jgi:hypothetical protein